MICLLGEVWTGPILSIPLQFSRFGSRNVLFDDGRMILHGCAARNSKNTLHLCISSNFLASQNETRSGTQSCLYIHIYLYNRKVHIPVYICSHIYVYIYIYIYMREIETIFEYIVPMYCVCYFYCLTIFLDQTATTKHLHTWFVWARAWVALGRAVLPKVVPNPDGYSTVFLYFRTKPPRPKNPAQDTCDLC